MNFQKRTAPDGSVEPQTRPVSGAQGESVSVVITAYNHARWLPEAVESVRAQTHSPIELIVVDDGSTDETPAICAGLEGVKILRRENSGLSAARNAGLRAAGGDLIAFLDADDLLLPDAIAAGVAALADRPELAFAHGGHLGVLADRTPIWETRARVEDATYRALLRGNLIGMHATVLYRRAILLELGGFDEKLTAAEDYDMYLRLAARHPFGCHDAIVAEYRQHGTNMSGDPGRMLRGTLAALEAQRARATCDPQDAAALAEGLAFYRASYGPPLVKRGIRDLARPEGHKAGREALALAGRLAPDAFAPALRDGARSLARTIDARMPPQARRFARRILRGRRGAQAPNGVVPKGEVRFGDLRRTSPIDPDFGFSRGLPVDRHYVEAFLEAQSDAIAGRVLEIGDDAYTRRFGGDGVARADVLHVSPDAPGATFTGDLADAPNLPDAAFDCVVLTQTLHLIFDMQAAIGTLARILKPGGVLLLTTPGISQIDRGEWGDTWFWSLTPAAVRRLLGGREWSDLRVESHGNVLAATAFLQGLAADELTLDELSTRDLAYPVIVTARVARARDTLRAGDRA